MSSTPPSLARRRLGLWWGLLTLFFAIASARVFAAESPSPVVEMEPFEVTVSSFKFERWSKIASPNFVIYTDADPVVAMALLRQLETLHAGIQRLFGRVALRRPPITFVLPTTSSDWGELEVRARLGRTVSLRIQTLALGELVTGYAEWQQLPRALFWSTVADAELRWLNLPRTIWFMRGLAGFARTAQISNDQIVIGRPNTGGPGRGGEFPDGWMPWPQFFATRVPVSQITRGGPPHAARGQAFADSFGPQAIAFVQYLLTRPDRTMVDRLLAWVALAEAGTPPSEAEFTALFGQDWNAWQKTMTAYVATGNARASTMKLPPDALPFDITQTRAAPSEMRELFILVQLLSPRMPNGEESLRGLLKRGLRTEDLRPLLIEACFKWNLPSEGEAQLRRFFETEPQNADAYALAAEKRFTATVAAPSATSRLSREIAEEIQSLSRRALAIEPRLPRANDLLAQALAFGPEVGPAQIEELGKLYRNLTGNTSTATVVNALAVAYLRTGDRTAAREIAEAVKTSKFADAGDRKFADSVLAEIDSPAAVGPTPAAAR